jgi:hypothetical protein
MTMTDLVLNGRTITYQGVDGKPKTIPIPDGFTARDFQDHINMAAMPAGDLARKGAAWDASQAEFNKQMAERQAAINAQQAQTIRDQAAVDVQASRRHTANALGAFRARTAANGVDLASGSPLDIQADIASQGELDAETAMNNAERRAWALQNQADDETARAGALAASADMARSQGDLQMARAGLGMAQSATKAIPGLFDAFG